MPAEIRQVFRAGADRVYQGKALDAAAGALRGVPVAGQNKRGLSVKLLYTRGDDTNHAGMPAFTIDDDYPVAPNRGTACELLFNGF